MSSIDEDAKLIGVNEKLWKDFKKMYVQDDLDGFAQAEAEAREAKIDEETRIRHKQAMAQKWFRYYRACKDPQKKMSLIDQYNKIAQQRQRQ